MDASDYNGGLRGGRIRVRARIELGDKKNVLRIVEVPFGTTTGSLMDSIVAANEKGKIKVLRVEDNTAAEVEILVHLPPGIDAEQTIQALYAFTDCEISLAPNAVVIHDNKPRFLSVNDLVKVCADHTRDILERELRIKLGELEEKWHFSSLEKIFIEKRIYRDIEECTTWEAVINAIWKGLKPYLKLLKREVVDDDIARLTEIRIKRISKFNSFEADEHISALEKDIAEVERQLKQLTRYTIAHFERLKKTYGPGQERRTEVTTFDRIAASEVIMANETLYLNAKDGFAGYGLKREGEPLFKCSPLDDIIYFSPEGSVTVSKVAAKLFVGKNPLLLEIFKKDDEAIYTVIYRDGRAGRTYAKRFRMGGITRDKAYPITQGTPGSRILYFAKHNAEAESDAQTLAVILKPALYLRNLTLTIPMASLGIKSRGALGNIVTKHAVDRISRQKKEAAE